MPTGEFLTKWPIGPEPSLCAHCCTRTTDHGRTHCSRCSRLYSDSNHVTYDGCEACDRERAAPETARLSALADAELAVNACSCDGIEAGMANPRTEPWIVVGFNRTTCSFQMRVPASPDCADWPH